MNHTDFIVTWRNTSLTADKHARDHDIRIRSSNLDFKECFLRSLPVHVKLKLLTRAPKKKTCWFIQLTKTAYRSGHRFSKQASEYDNKIEKSVSTEWWSVELTALYTIRTVARRSVSASLNCTRKEPRIYKKLPFILYCCVFWLKIIRWYTGSGRK